MILVDVVWMTKTGDGNGKWRDRRRMKKLGKKKE